MVQCERMCTRRNGRFPREGYTQDSLHRGLIALMIWIHVGPYDRGLAPLEQDPHNLQQLRQNGVLRQATSSSMWSKPKV